MHNIDKAATGQAKSDHEGSKKKPDFAWPGSRHHAVLTPIMYLPLCTCRGISVHARQRGPASEAGAAMNDAKDPSLGSTLSHLQRGQDEMHPRHSRY